MPLVELICLANSTKMLGRCIAGLRTDGKGWVRPIASDTDHGQLYLRHFKLDDGAEPRTLDVIRVDLARAEPAPGQPENWIIGTAPWRLASRPSRLTSSLTLVSPSKLRWKLKQDLRGNPQPRVTFELAGQPYDLPVTDPMWTSRIVRKLSQAEPGSYAQEKIGIPQSSKVLLTVSLSEPLDGYCYKLAAAIVVMPSL